MGRLLIVNGSPRAPKSNSQKYIEQFRNFWPREAFEYKVTAKKHQEICQSLLGYDDLLFAFPLYADGLPAALMHFLKKIEQYPPFPPLTVHVLINCGFIEPEQNEVACEMVRLFCEQNGFLFGSVLKIGSGEAILTTPFAPLVTRRLKKLADAIWNHKPVQLKVSMPLPKKVYIRASTKYWLQYGEKYGVGKEQMDTMKIE